MSTHKEKRIVKNCKKHGDVPFILEGRGYYRCTKCRVEAVHRRRRKVKAMAVEHKGGKCERCGYDKFIGALEFHHKDPSKKDFAIAAKGHCRSWAKVKEELDKCSMLCSNCHKEVHEEIRENNILG